MSLKQRLYTGLFFLFFSIALVLTIALSLPETTWQFSISAEQNLQASNSNYPLTTVDFFLTGEQQTQALSHLALEEPDTVETYAEFNHLMAVNDFLIINIDRLSMQLADGSVHPLAFQERTIFNLPALFWLQIGRASRLNSSHVRISYAVFCLKKKINIFSVLLCLL